MTIFHDLRNYWKRMGLFQYAIWIFGHLRMRCSKFITISLHQYLLRFLINKIQTTNYATLLTFLPVRSVYNGTESLSFLGHKIWDIVPTELEEVKTLSAFKSETKNWWPQNCPCKLCKWYLPPIGFIERWPIYLVVAEECACLIKVWLYVTFCCQWALKGQA